MSLSVDTTRALHTYGVQACLAAYRQNTVNGEGASTIAYARRDWTPRMADDAIDAGRELTEARDAVIGSTCPQCGEVHADPIEYYYHSPQFLNFVHFKSQWEIQHRIYGNTNPVELSHARKLLLDSEDAMRAALDLARVTPEHFAAFGW